MIMNRFTNEYDVGERRASGEVLRVPFRASMLCIDRIDNREIKHIKSSYKKIFFHFRFFLFARRSC